ncbi:hypothetical protein [Phaffia rhodozyma]|uniref:Uncharacterized protein n=1 Tax=Phaffia rhodozyma TaxID=264483 RepID=A0A0F7SPI4_PHARH|nr:hypothetical protein [Phaffia rhodozyma]
MDRAQTTPFPTRPRLNLPLPSVLSQRTPDELRRLEGVWRALRQTELSARPTTVWKGKQKEFRPYDGPNESESEVNARTLYEGKENEWTPDVVRQGVRLTRRQTSWPERKVSRSTIMTGSSTSLAGHSSVQGSRVDRSGQRYPSAASIVSSSRPSRHVSYLDEFQSRPPSSLYPISRVPSVYPSGPTVASSERYASDPTRKSSHSSSRSGKHQGSPSLPPLPSPALSPSTSSPRQPSSCTKSHNAELKSDQKPKLQNLPLRQRNNDRSPNRSQLKTRSESAAHLFQAHPMRTNRYDRPCPTTSSTISSELDVSIQPIYDQHPALNPLSTVHLPGKEQGLKHGFVRIVQAGRSEAEGESRVELWLRGEMWVLTGDGLQLSFWSASSLILPTSVEESAQEVQYLPLPDVTWDAPFEKKLVHARPGGSTSKHRKRLRFLEKWITAERERTVFSKLTLPPPEYPPHTSLTIYSNPPHPSLKLYVRFPSSSRRSSYRTESRSSAGACAGTRIEELSIHLDFSSETLSIERRSKGLYVHKRVLVSETETTGSLVGPEIEGWELMRN